MNRLIVALLLLSCPLALAGQGARYIIRNYDLMNELNLNGSTWSVMEDSSGILYFGADYGLVTYDGSVWSLYSRDQSIVRSLLYDSRQRMIYGGFNDFGLLERDRRLGLTFRSLLAGVPEALRNFGDIWSICEADGRVFLQAKRRVFVLEGDSVSAFEVEDSYHRGFLIGGMYVLNQKGIGLTVFDGSAFKPLPGGAFFRDRVISFAVDLEPGYALIGTRQEGLYVIDIQGGTISRPFEKHPETSRLLEANNIYHGIALPDGTLAFATLFGGTLLTDREGRILKMLSRNHGMRDNVHYALRLGRDYNLWICTSNGISSFNINSPFILWDHTAGIEGVVLSIQADREDILVGTLTGLYRIPGASGEREPFRQQAEKIISTEVWNIAPIRRGNETRLYLGTGSGLYWMLGNEAVPERQDGIVLKVMQLKCNPDVVLALSADELNLYRWIGGRYRHYASVQNVFNGFRTAGEDVEGYLWVGTRHAGVVRIPICQLAQLALAEGEVAHYQELGLDHRVYPFESLLTDVIEYEGKVLFSNYQGLFQYDAGKDAFEKSLLFGPEVARFNRMASTLNRDSRGNIWVGGEDILMARPDGTYSPDKLNFQQLIDAFSAFVFLHGNDQRTWIGGNNGVYLYNSKAAFKFPPGMRTIITRIAMPDGSSIHLPAPPRPDEEAQPVIDLARRNSQVTFYYSLPYFDNEQRTQYSYRLDGYSDDWSGWSTDAQVTFSNLKPGSYCFRVRGRTIYNQQGEEAVICFDVPRRWYFSRYAIAAYLVLLILLIWQVAGYISRIRIRKHLRIEDLIRKRIQESQRASLINLMNVHPGPGSAEVTVRPEMAAALPHGGPPPARDQQFLSAALKILEEQMSNHQLTAGQFCREMGMSQTRVYRKLIALTGMSINQFIRNIRLRKAAELLLSTDLPISEIAYQTGFSSPGYFTKCFTSEFGVNPRDFNPARK
ncbi:MAG: helix-turn-helix domain-containing protein [Bacteroidales bacterium]